MFILRKISKSWVEMNFILGKTFTHTDRQFAYVEFCRMFHHEFGKPHVADTDPTADDDTKRVYGFISNEDGDRIIPLWEGQKTYIMTSDGKTFDNLTLKS